MAIIVGETRSYNNLTSIVLGNHPNGVDRTRKHEKTGEKQVDPKISANPDRQKYAQGGNENCNEYAYETTHVSYSKRLLSFNLTSLADRTFPEKFRRCCHSVNFGFIGNYFS